MSDSREQIINETLEWARDWLTADTDLTPEQAGRLYTTGLAALTPQPEQPDLDPAADRGVTEGARRAARGRGNGLGRPHRRAEAAPACHPIPPTHRIRAERLDTMERR